MKLKTDTPLRDLKGKPVLEEGKEIPVAAILSNTLAATKTDNPYLSYFLAKELATKKEVDLKAEQVVHIKQVLNESALTPLASGQIIALLDGE